MPSAVSKIPALVRSSDPANPPFPDDLALVFHRENGRYQLCKIGGEPVLEIEPSGGGNFNINPLANPGPGWLTSAGWPVVAGYTKNP